MSDTFRQRSDTSGRTWPARRTRWARTSTSPAGSSLLQWVATAAGISPSQWRPTSIRSASTSRSKSASAAQPDSRPEPRRRVDPECASSRSQTAPSRFAVNAADTSLIANGRLACSKWPDSSLPDTANVARSSAASSPPARQSMSSRPRSPASHSGGAAAASISPRSRGERSRAPTWPASSNVPSAERRPSKPARSNRSPATEPRTMVLARPSPPSTGSSSTPMFLRVRRVPTPAPSTSSVASSMVTGTRSLAVRPGTRAVRLQPPSVRRNACTTGRTTRIDVIRGSPASRSLSVVPQATRASATARRQRCSGGSLASMNETPRTTMPSPSTRLAASTRTVRPGIISWSRASTLLRTSSPMRFEPSATATTTAAADSGRIQRTSVQSRAVRNFIRPARGMPEETRGSGR